ncbi:MAG: lipopolysaccharide transport periplasmic protein LptA [Campylobacterales bacterium]|nr:lipopolysaccharide transport periplasmic protein LptA [Campylobacterales bacterium]
MTKKIISLFLLFSIFCVGEKIEIKSLNMEADDFKKEVHFNGDVKIKEGKSRLDSNDAVVYLDAQNKAKEYKATGNVVFYINKDGNEYKGKAGEVRYFPNTNIYHLSINAEVEDIINKRVLTGNKMILDMNKKQVKVDGKKNKPIEFIFETKDK